MNKANPRAGASRLYPHARSGQRPSTERLLGAVTEMPPGARAKTVRVLRDMAAAGVELDETAIGIAVKLGSVPDLRALAEPQLAVPSPLMPDSIVYYIRRGPLIKIGTTKNPRKRFSSLMPDAILAFEPGDERAEQARHRQFTHLAVGRRPTEYFRPAPELLEHIQRTADTYGPPPSDWPSTANYRHSGLPSPQEPVSGETLTITQASERFGTNRATIRAWARRGCILIAGLDEHGHRVFYADQIRALAHASHPRV